MSIFLNPNSTTQRQTTNQSPRLEQELPPGIQASLALGSGFTDLNGLTKKNDFDVSIFKK